METLTPEEVLALVRESWTEAEFTRELVALARSLGWLAVHFRAARTAKGWRTALTGDPGYVDVTLAKGRRVIFAELKAKGRRLRSGQERWAAVLAAVGGNVLYRKWEPKDWNTIVETLRDGP